ncbi:hypothetical protein BJV82DRAFT_690445 [Fennellomyces sp. T-0311]|nr:hypothetical protein BJV82DRAFT_690445 [Fennellomyces sp. T-0311]
MADLRHSAGVPMDHTPAWMHSMAPDRRRLPPPPPTVVQHPYPAESPANNKSTRVVIPSKRAAQNRAAQRAFRQRRDRYVKDLEKKSKEMENWPEEMEQLRTENNQLRSTVASLERRIAELTGQTPVSSSASSTGSAEFKLAPPPPHHQHQSPPTSPQPSPLASPLLPVPLRAPHQQSFTPPSTSAAPPHPPAPTYQDDSHANRDTSNPQPAVESTVTENPPVQHSQQDLWAFDNFELEFAFDSYYQDDFAPPVNNAANHHMGPGDDAMYNMNGNANSGQVLDDLFEMLQTRQRPQIPLQPAATDMTMQSTAMMIPQPQAPSYPIVRVPLPQ